MGRIAAKPKQSGTYTVIQNNMSEMRVGMKMQMATAADKLGMAYGTYGSFESGHALPSQAVLESICKLYKCLVSDIYDAVIWGYIFAQHVEWEAKAKLEELEDA